jgi:uncharacterized protein YbbC (DUF1343 family)
MSWVGCRIQDTGCRIIYLLLFLQFPIVSYSQIHTGAERTTLYYPLLAGKHIAIVANAASVVGDSNIVDILVRQGFRVACIFSPEHGFRVSAEAGQAIGNSIDPVTGIRVISLYGEKQKPGAQDLKSIDLLLFDLQDVGVRFYTYISTLCVVMEACAQNDVPVILLDRPNPNGFYVDGPVLEMKYRSFVGMCPVPVVYGMTIGEYASMVLGEGWLKNGKRCDLCVIPLENYKHQDLCVMPAKPSPNLPNPVAIELYPSLCFFEGTNISVGRGTPFPFQVYGHPDLKYGNISFTPESIPGVSLHPPMEGKVCHGEDLRRFYKDNPADAGKITLKWLINAYKNWNGKTPFFTPYFDKLAGNATLQKQIVQGKSEKEIRRSWKTGIDKFMKIREKYLLY